MTKNARKSLISVRLKDKCHHPSPCVFTLSCWSFSKLCLAQMTQYQLVSEDICVCSLHGKSAVGTTALPKPHLCNELITWEFSSQWVTSATSGQKNCRRLHS